jgi:hypothetical protein
MPAAKALGITPSNSGTKLRQQVVVLALLGYV